MRASPSGSRSARFINTPIRRIRSPCCARAASGHATAAQPSSDIKSRRLIALIPTQDHGSVAGQGVHRSKSGPLMSALGHQRPMRSKPPGHPCPLYPESRQTAESLGMSASCQSRPSALQQKAPLFDHLVVRAASVGGTSRLVRKDSRNERYGIFGRDRADHSALMPANLITLAHFSVSAAMCLPKSVGGPPNGVAPRSASRACILGSDRAALIALLRVSITSAGVLLGAQKPPQKLAS